MKNYVKSYFNYPSTVVVLDDNKTFLDDLSLILRPRQCEMSRFFSQPQKALSYLKKQNYIYKNYDYFLETFKAVELDADDRDIISKINFNNILNLIYNKERFNEVSVVVVDYFMPEMNGLEFFKKIEEIPAKKILLTGNSDYQLAVNAFNQGLIDRFILKEDGMEDKILDSINELKNMYFQEFSIALLQAFNKGIKRTDQYVKVFTDWYNKNSIKEHYQCGGNGSCVGFDNNGEIHCLLITSEAEMYNYIDVIKEEPNNSTILKSLEPKEKSLFFLTEKEKCQPVSGWDKHMFKTRGSFVINKERYFFSYASKELRGIDTEKVVTWHQMQNN